MADGTNALRQAHGAYVDTRRWALGASTRRLRWRLRRLAAHSADQQSAARRKALIDELRDRERAS